MLSLIFNLSICSWSFIAYIFNTKFLHEKCNTEYFQKYSIDEQETWLGKFWLYPLQSLRFGNTHLTSGKLIFFIYWSEILIPNWQDYWECKRRKHLKIIFLNLKLMLLRYTLYMWKCFIKHYRNYQHHHYQPVRFA